MSGIRGLSQRWDYFCTFSSSSAAGHLAPLGIQDYFHRVVRYGCLRVMRGVCGSKVVKKKKKKAAEGDAGLVSSLFVRWRACLFSLIFRKFSGKISSYYHFRVFQGRESHLYCSWRDILGPRGSGWSVV